MKQKQFAIVLHGMHTSSNFGDLLLTMIIRDWLQQAGYNRLSLLAASEEVSRSLKLPRATAKNYLEADVVLLGGGGFFQRMDRSVGALKAIVRYALPIVFAGMLGKKNGMIGIGLDKLPHPFLDVTLGMMLRFTNLIIVRDEKGFRQAKRLLGNSSTLLDQGSDLVFTLDNEWLTHEAKTWASTVRQELGVDKLLAVHLSETSSGTNGYPHLFDALNHQLPREKNCGIVLIEDHEAKDSQQKLAQYEMAQLMDNSNVRIVPYPGVTRLAALLAEVDTVLTNKLHVALCAAALGTTPYSVAKHRKNLVSFDDIGLSENCCMISDSPEKIQDIVERFVNHSGSFACPEQVRERAQKGRVQLLKLIGTSTDRVVGRQELE